MSDYNFDDIRPYCDAEVPDAIKRIVDSGRLYTLLSGILPQQAIDAIAQKLPLAKTVDDFQLGIIKMVVEGILQKTGCNLFDKHTSRIHSDSGHLFISNHRDIVIDPTMLDYVLHAAGILTVEIAIGNNLLIEPWIEDLVRVNKSFIVKRNLQGRELLESSQKMSAYIRHVVTEKNANVWIAQREGRAKDGDDRTQMALLKMLNMSADKTHPVHAFNALNIIPLAISYEFDTCDVLKAKELYVQSLGQTFVKSPMDDLLSMKYGIIGLRGRVCYAFGHQITLDESLKQMTTNELVEHLAAQIDQQIFSNTELFPSHYFAFDTFFNTSRFADRYTPEQVTYFQQLIEKKIATLLPEYSGNADFVMQVYRQYANIVKNALGL